MKKPSQIELMLRQSLSLLGAGALIAVSASHANEIERVSVAADGTQANNQSDRPGMSLNGQYVVFQSSADNLVPGGSNGQRQIYLKNRKTGAISIVSTAADGTLGQYGSGNPTVTADGRFVCFNSGASNLVPDHDNTDGDVFVKDVKTGSIEWVSKAPDGSANDNGSANAFITPDGRYVVFQSRASNLDPEGDSNGSNADIFVKDRKTGTLERVSETADGTQANYACENPYITPDGRFVSFYSSADNLVPGDTNSRSDIFVKDRKTGVVELVSSSSDEMIGDGGCYCHHISDDGRFVIFRSSSTNLVPNDTNNAYDAFVKDRETGRTERVSVAADGTEADSTSGGVWISPDGRFTFFWSAATNLVPSSVMYPTNYYQVYLKDRQNGAIALISADADGNRGDEYSQGTFMTGAGYVAFKSRATNLVQNDTNGSPNLYMGEDIFVAKNPFAAFQPDTLIGPRRTHLSGNNRYFQGSSRQQVSLRGKAGKSHRFYFKVQNDANVFDDILTTASRGGGKYRTVYREVRGGNATSELTGGGAEHGMIPGQERIYEAMVRPKRKVRSRVSIPILSRSMTVAGSRDIAKANIENDAPDQEPSSISPRGVHY